LEGNKKMRIISGKLKGKSLSFLKNSTTRPLKDSVKENIFNILKHSNLINLKIDKANILDLYSGIGSFGLECISRGAKKVTFIEQDKNAFAVLKENVLKLSIIKDTKIINDKIENFLNSTLQEKYDILFLDPPFSDQEFIKSLKNISQKKIYKKDHLVIIHRELNANDEFDEFLDVLLFREYGRSKIFFGTFN
tara:strand:+ start:231 stop:809 length:579 start_codon:yes stop_codon:yes gene_type:complete